MTAAKEFRVQGGEKINLHQPAQPAPQVRVFGGWENSNPHLYLRQPVPVTHAGCPTHDFPYVCIGNGQSVLSEVSSS